MSGVLDRARRLLSGDRTELVDRVSGLEVAVDAAARHLDDPEVDRARALVARAGERLRLSTDHTVVALAGATGSGKSSIFNALCGAEVARTGVLRPTTTTTSACVWGDEAAGPLLDWLRVARRHRIDDGSADGHPERATRELDGLVLLDLPDHDSTETSHHREVDRLADLADMFVWVLDPQKYADAAVHERYLRPLARHAATTLVVLNQVDRVPQVRREAVLTDLRRLLAEDGLGDVPVLAVSALDGTGTDDLRAEIASRVARRDASRRRLLADVLDAGRLVADTLGDVEPGELPAAARDELVDAFAQAAGVPTVTAAVGEAARRRGRSATGWPLTSWIGRLKPDPLRRLHLDLGGSGPDLVTAARTSLPAPGSVELARVDGAVRRVVDARTEGLPTPWVAAVRRAATAPREDVADALDRAVVGVDLGMATQPFWVRAVRSMQWVLLAVALAGAVWLGVLAVLGYLQIDAPDAATGARYAGVPLPTLMLLGGVAAGVVLALLTRYVVSWSARRRARQADRELRAAVAEVADRLVLQPVDEVLADLRRAREGLRVVAT